MKELDLTQGSVPKVLLHFAVPFLLANVLQDSTEEPTCLWWGSMTMLRVWPPWPSEVR